MRLRSFAISPPYESNALHLREHDGYTLLDDADYVMTEEQSAAAVAAHDSLLAFTQYTFPDYDVAPHHKVIAKALEAVEAGRIKRLLITAPPRHGKSELLSRRFPAWYLGRNPTAEFVGASYNFELATEFGRDVRDIVASDEYADVFDMRLALDSRAKGRWNTTAGGSYRAAGVGTSLTGRGADVLNIDDPVKDAEDAASEIQRETKWNWFRQVARTRLSPDGAILLTLTRWHEDDLGGRVLEQMEEGKSVPWTVIDLPAIAIRGEIDALDRKPGEALWQSRWPKKALAELRADIGERAWSALYQGRPMPEGGAYFLRDDLTYYDTKPRTLRMYMASDYAVGTRDENDYTVHMVGGVDMAGRLFVVDLWRDRATSDAWVESGIDLVELHKPLNWFEEKGQIEKGVGPFLTKRMKERRSHCKRTALTSSVDKVIRARAIQARFSMGMVLLPRNADWAADLVSELLKFPNGKHDDQVDCLSLFGRMLDQMVAPRRNPARSTVAKFDFNSF